MRHSCELRNNLGIIRDAINLRMVSDEEKRKSKGEEPHSKPTAVQERGSRYPLFNQFSRKWLTEVLGYSEGYLCRIATGGKPLSKSFIARRCYRLKETELELFDTSSGL